MFVERICEITDEMKCIVIMMTILNPGRISREADRQAGWRTVMRANDLIDFQFHVIYSGGKTT